MSVKAIREYDAKKILQMNWDNTKSDELGIKGMMVPPAVLDGTSGATWDKLLEENPWVTDLKLVAKPDQLVKRRGKLGLVAVNMTFPEAQKWILDRMMKDISIEGVKGMLTHFLIEPFMKHDQADELYVCIQSHRYFDEVIVLDTSIVNDTSSNQAWSRRLISSVGLGPRMFQIFFKGVQSSNVDLDTQGLQIC